MADDQTYSYEKLSETANYIKSKISITPKVLIICGSGLGGLADVIQGPTVVNYGDIPNFPVSTVHGHSGKLIIGTLSNTPVVCMQGRFHYYEGYSLQKVTMPVRVMKLIGVEYLIVTNAAGGVNESYKVGDVMLIKDHVNWIGFGGSHPLRGPNDERFGERFFPVNKTYDRAIIKKAKQVACEVGLAKYLKEGVYSMVGGPNYESIAEINCLKTCGVDAVGMSTVPEVLVATHCGIKVFGFSLITNECIHRYDDEREPNHLEVLKAVDARAKELQKFVTHLVEYMK